MTVPQISIHNNKCCRYSWLQPGFPMAPGKCYLPLLPFGSDGVYNHPPHRTRANPYHYKPHIC